MVRTRAHTHTLPGHGLPLPLFVELVTYLRALSQQPKVLVGCWLRWGVALVGRWPRFVSRGGSGSVPV